MKKSNCKKCLVLSLFLFLIVGCAVPQRDTRPDLKVAVGYIENQKNLSDEIRGIMTKQLSGQYSLDFIPLKSSDINFEEKNVVWDIGIGGTIFALKELGEGIQFYPLMWEDRCSKSPLLVSMNRQKDHSLKKANKILVLHSDYPSVLSLSLLYDLKSKKIYETSDSQKAMLALAQGEVDIIVSEATTRLLSQKTQVTFPFLLENANIDTKIMREIEIPCRTLFYSPKVSLQDRLEVISRLENYPWKGQGHDLLPLKAVDMEEFQKIQSLFDWKKDNQLRKSLRPL